MNSQQHLLLTSQGSHPFHIYVQVFGGAAGLSAKDLAGSDAFYSRAQQLYDSMDSLYEATFGVQTRDPLPGEDKGIFHNHRRAMKALLERAEKLRLFPAGSTM